MDWQQITSLFIVAISALLLARHGLKKRKRVAAGLCGGECGCTSAPPLAEQLGKMREEQRENEVHQSSGQ
jgi:hypothetical protein